MLRITLFALLGSFTALPAQSLPLVEEVDWPAFRGHGNELLAGLKKLGTPLPSAAAKAVESLLAEKEPADPRQAALAVQKLLDAHCLVGVHINPESRVKAARGERRPELVRDQATYVLVKVHNEGGVTHPLSVASEQAVRGKADAGRWVEVTVVNDKPFAGRLSGRRVEYRVMKLVACQSGKREATLSFDAGQGTQDLGFRSEVPVLFTVRPK
jgi:hypothetical protein